MTQQIEDNFVYNDEEYILSAVEFPSTFLDFSKFKLNPIEMHTACYRGFVITFAVKDVQLIVDQILTNNQTYTKNHKRKTVVIHKINGVLPEVIEPEGLVEGYKKYRELHYKNLNYNLDYTGAIIIVKDFMYKYVSAHSAFLSISPFCYKTIIRLTFFNGHLTNIKNLSNYGKKIRAERRNKLKDEKYNSAHFDWPDVDILFKKYVNRNIGISGDALTKEGRVRIRADIAEYFDRVERAKRREDVDLDAMGWGCAFNTWYSYVFGVQAPRNHPKDVGLFEFWAERILKGLDELETKKRKN
jgi:hypothetical protein